MSKLKAVFLTVNKKYTPQLSYNLRHPSAPRINQRSSLPTTQPDLLLPERTVNLTEPHQEKAFSL
jgi:hypothetical protein